MGFEGGGEGEFAASEVIPFEILELRRHLVKGEDGEATERV